jgi:hypothetical protein
MPMTPEDHNKTLSIIYGLIGILILIALTIWGVLEARRHPSDIIQRVGWGFYLLPIPLLKLLTAYGLYSRRRWARIIALIFSVLYIWIFPLGTILAIYTWSFCFSADGRRFYTKA